MWVSIPSWPSILITAWVHFQQTNPPLPKHNLWAKRSRNQNLFRDPISVMEKNLYWWCETLSLKFGKWCCFFGGGSYFSWRECNPLKLIYQIIFWPKKAVEFVIAVLAVEWLSTCVGFQCTIQTSEIFGIIRRMLLNMCLQSDLTIDQWEIDFFNYYLQEWLLYQLLAFKSTKVHKPCILPIVGFSFSDLDLFDLKLSGDWTFPSISKGLQHYNHGI